jgi:RNA recognition motif. (a.k.a. RRM, RBD, or RNP domain)
MNESVKAGGTVILVADDEVALRTLFLVKMKKTLYVGNLSRETTEAQLKGLFDQAGFVERVRIIRNRATGFRRVLDLST